MKPFKALNDEKGNSVIFLLIVMALIIFCAAIVIDVGMILVVKQRVAAAADAAALAGAAVLDQGEEVALATANQMAQKNGLTDWDVIVDAEKQTVLVTGKEKVNLFFGPFLNKLDQHVSAEAMAKAGVISGGEGFVPLAVEDQEFVFGESYVLKHGGGSGHSGNYGALALGGSGASNYLRNLMYGYDGYLEIGMKVETEPGNMSGPTYDGITYRLEQDEAIPKCQSYLTADSQCNRLIYVPVIDSLDVNGRSTVTIVGFAAFFLEGVDGKGNNSTVRGRFIRRLVQGELSSDESAKDYGLKGIKLIR